MMPVLAPLVFGPDEIDEKVSREKQKRESPVFGLQLKSHVNQKKSPGFSKNLFRY